MSAKFSPGDRVIVRPQYRSKFIDGSAAARGEPLVVHAGVPAGVVPTELSVGQVQIGPLPLDFAYEHELEAAAPEVQP